MVITPSPTTTEVPASGSGTWVSVGAHAARHLHGARAEDAEAGAFEVEVHGVVACVEHGDRAGRPSDEAEHPDGRRADHPCRPVGGRDVHPTDPSRRGRGAS